MERTFWSVTGGLIFMILTIKGAQVKEKAKEAFKYAAFLS